MRASWSIRGFAIAAAATVALIAACGGGDEGADNDIEVKADEYKFTPNEITIPAGQTVTIRLKNVGATEHDLEVQGLRVEMTGGHEAAGDHAGAAPGTLVLHSEKGKTVAATFMAEQPGTYEIWCTISGHKEQGMVGKLIVTSSTSQGAGSTDVGPSSRSPANTTAPSTPSISIGDGGHGDH